MAKAKQHGGARKGAGRKPANPEGPTTTVVATVPETLVTTLDEIAQLEGWNRSRAVTEAIRGLIKRKQRA
jgi:alkylated DNA nucleotide flippase Atl1